MNDRLLNKLNVLFDSLAPEYNYEGMPVSFKKSDSANNAQIHKLREQLPNTLPEEYASFLKHTNGCTIYDYKKLDGFRFFDTEEMIRENNHINDVYSTFSQNIIIFCAILGEGNFLGFKVVSQSEYAILDCFHEEIAQNWKSIGDSFSSFLEKLIDKHGEKFWL